MRNVLNMTNIYEKVIRDQDEKIKALQQEIDELKQNSKNIQMIQRVETPEKKQNDDAAGWLLIISGSIIIMLYFGGFCTV